MIDPALLSQFSKQFDDLKFVVDESLTRTTSENPDALFYDNQNVFIKSYLVSACSILEAFIQELAESYIAVLQLRINKANLPYNFVVWIADHDKAKLSYGKFEGKKTKKDITDMISPNYYRTITAFERIGINLSSPEISAYKDYVSSIVDKRNKIVHHNDAAYDLSFLDIVLTIDQFKKYSECLYNTVSADPHIEA